MMLNMTLVSRLENDKMTPCPFLASQPPFSLESIQIIGPRPGGKQAIIWVRWRGLDLGLRLVVKVNGAPFPNDARAIVYRARSHVRVQRPIPDAEPLGNFLPPFHFAFSPGDPIPGCSLEFPHYHSPLVQQSVPGVDFLQAVVLAREWFLVAVGPRVIAT